MSLSNRSATLMKNKTIQYGNTASIVTQTPTGTFDPYTGETFTRTETPIKAHITNISTNEALNNMVDNYELYMKLDATHPITKETIINYDGTDYEIVPNGLFIKKFQDTIIFYEILVKGSNN